MCTVSEGSGVWGGGGGAFAAGDWTAGARCADETGLIIVVLLQTSHRHARADCECGLPLAYEGEFGRGLEPGEPVFPGGEEFGVNTELPRPCDILFAIVKEESFGRGDV